MNKSELIEALASEGKFEKGEAEIAVNTMVNIISREIIGGGKVLIGGFGKFYSKPRKEKVGRNMKTGEEVIIPERIVPKFRPAKKLSESLSQKN